MSSDVDNTPIASIIAFCGLIHHGRLDASVNYKTPVCESDFRILMVSSGREHTFSPIDVEHGQVTNSWPRPFIMTLYSQLQDVQVHTCVTTRLKKIETVLVVL